MIVNPQAHYRKQHEDLRNRRDDALKQVEEIQQRAREAIRENTPNECQEIDANFQLINDLDGQLRVVETKMRDQQHVQRLIDDGLLPVDNRAASRAAGASTWIDQATGRPVHMLSNKERFSDLPQANPALAGCSIGDVVQAAVSGNWKRISSDVRNAMSGGTAGSFLVPDELMSNVIDLARANSVIVKAGAVSIRMGSDSLTLARVRTDPTFATRIENDSITETDITFDKLNLVAHNFGALIKCSRELADDAPNFAQLVTGTLSRAFAAKLDYVAINGTTSTHPSGVLQWGTDSGVTETTSVGAIAWEDLHAAAVAVREQNYEPTGYIVHPTIAGDLDILTTGDGTNSSKGWLGAPPSLAGVTRYGTTNCPTSSIVMGDWSQFAIGIRQGAMIEVSTNSGTAFEKHQVWIKLTWRGDFAAFRRNAFHRLVGITT